MRRLSISVRPLACVSRFGYGLVWLLVIALLLVGCASHDEYVDVTAILARIHQGDDREQVILALSDAWYHSTCNLAYGQVDDVFLYGSRKRNKVTLIVIRSVPRGNQMVIESAGSPENYFIDNPNWSEICEPPILQAFEKGGNLTTRVP